MQSYFAIAMLGGPKLYKGKPLKSAHMKLPLKHAHFDRRQVIMREVLEDLDLEKSLVDEWMKLEEGLRPLVVVTAPCSD